MLYYSIIKYNIKSMKSITIINIIKLLEKRQIGSKKCQGILRRLERYVNLNNNQTLCKNDHSWGYSPFIKYGPCRFCGGYRTRGLHSFLIGYLSSK